MTDEFQINYRFTAETMTTFGTAINCVCCFPSFVDEVLARIQDAINDGRDDDAAQLTGELRREAANAHKIADWFAQQIGKVEPTRIDGGPLQ